MASERCQNFIDKAKLVNGDKYKYNYDLVEYKNAKTKVKIKCSIHGVFEQTPDNHLRGNGCPTCGLESRLKKRTKTQEFVIKQFEEIHKDTYEYDEVKYTKDDKLVKIKCKIHGMFEQTPNGHLAGKGCRKCGVQKMADSQRKTLDDFIKDSNEIHKNLYDYSISKYTDYHTKIQIICKKHGVFEQAPSHHLAGHGCQKCADEYIGILNRSSTDDFIENARKVHNQYYIYNEVEYKKSNIEVIIICPKHGKFFQLPCTHLRGHGCKKCSNQSSKISMEWLNMIKVNCPELRTYDDIEGEYRIPNTHYSADGYDEKTNTVFEFQGDYWHGNPLMFQSDQINPSKKCTFGELYDKTLNKRKILEELGYKYVEIWENKWNTLKRLILKKQRSIRK